MKLPLLLNMDPFKRQVWLVPIVVAFISFLNVPLARAYCWEPGRNPYFTGTPIVQQVDLRTVRVSWAGLVESVECADQFLVKYWPKNNPQGYVLSELIKTDRFAIDIRITPKVYYVFQVIAREDKGSFAGIDYNKSKQTEFKTSSYNPNVRPTPKPTPKSPSPPSGGEATESASSNDNGESPASHPEEVIVEESEPESDLLLAGLSVELIAIIIVCSVVLLLIFVGLIYKLACAKKPEDIDDEDDDDEDDEDHFEKERLDV